MNTPIGVIKQCVLNNLLPPKCNCGTRTKYNISVKGIFYPMSCSFLCHSKDKRYCKAISQTKIVLYQDEEWKDAVEDKKVKTCLINNGVEYPMQNVDIFERQQAACFRKDENGLHGYEPHVYPFLLSLYPDITNGTYYLKSNNISIRWLDNGDNKIHHSYPDFFSGRNKFFHRD